MTTDAGPAMAASSARRTEIVDIARALFAQQGIRNTSMRDIAGASGMLPGSLYSHVRSKAQLIELAIQPFYDVILAEQDRVLARATDGATALREMVAAVFPTLLAHADETLILHYSWPELGDYGELGLLVEQGERILENWQRAARRAELDGSLARLVRSDLLVRVVNSAMFGLVDRYRYETLDGPIDQLGVDGVVRELTDLLIGAARHEVS